MCMFSPQESSMLSWNWAVESFEHEKHFYLLIEIFLSKSVYYTYKARENQNKTFRVIYALSGLHRLSNGHRSDRFASTLLNHKKLFVIQLSTFFEIDFFKYFVVIPIFYL